MSGSLEAIIASLCTLDLSSNYKELESKIKILTFIRAWITFRSAPSRDQVSACASFCISVWTSPKLFGKRQGAHIHTEPLSALSWQCLTLFPWLLWDYVAQTCFRFTVEFRKAPNSCQKLCPSFLSPSD